MGWTLSNNASPRYIGGFSVSDLSVHEAGHAVVGKEIGYTVSSINISADDPGCAGSVEFTKESQPELAEVVNCQSIEDYCVKLGAQYCAGVVAEYIEAGGLKPVPMFPSALQISDYNGVTIIFQMFQRFLLNLGNTSECDYANDLDCFLSKCCDYAYEILKVKWGYVAAIKAELQSSGVLNAVDCKRLLW